MVRLSVNGSEANVDEGMERDPRGSDARAIDGDRDAIFVRERPHLLAVAFRILGSDADAQDVVQEAWIRFAQADISDVRNIAAWLTAVVSRLCLDALRRARFVSPADVPELPNGPGGNPEEIALLASELTEALVIVLDALTPPQRVALVLHDVFGVPFTDVAHVLDTTPDAAKKMASRARQRLRARQPGTTGGDARQARRVVSAFLAAAQQGDLGGLLALLDPDVIRTADPQLLPPGGAQWLQGAQAVVHEAHANQARARHARLMTINGQPGIAVPSSSGVAIAMVFRIARGRIVHIDVIADPGRLAQLRVDG